jgi:hypothetical protein
VVLQFILILSVEIQTRQKRPTTASLYDLNPIETPHTQPLGGMLAPGTSARFKLFGAASHQIPVAS